MAIIWSEGFDAYPIASAFSPWYPPYTKWTGGYGGYGTGQFPGAEIVNSSRFSPSKGKCVHFKIAGTQHYKCNLNLLKTSGNIDIMNVNLPIMIVGFAFYRTGYDTSQNIIRLGNNDSEQFRLVQGTDKILKVALGNGTIIDTSTLSLTAGAWYYIELKVAFSTTTTGSYELRVDDQLVLSGTDLQTSVNSGTCNQITIGASVSSWNEDLRYDDMYIVDPSFGPSTDFLGPCIIKALYPNADTAVKDFTPSTGTDNYAMVDDTTGPSASDYVTSNLLGSKDEYDITELNELSQTVHGVVLSTAGYKTGTTTVGVKHYVNSNGVESSETFSAIGTTNTQRHTVFELDPDGDQAWTLTSINNLKIGIEVAE